MLLHGKKRLPLAAVLKTQLIKMLGVTSLSLFSLSALSQPIELSYGQHTLSLEPGTLAMQLHNPKGSVVLNEPSLRVSEQAQTPLWVEQARLNQAQWQLSPSQLLVTASFDDNGLYLSFDASKAASIARNKAMRLKWFNLAQSASEALLLPFNEGMRVPVANSAWASYLSEKLSGSNTTQDLKMPFWTQKLVTASTASPLFATVHLINPFNNRLHFSAQQGRVDLQAEHVFTALNQLQKFEVQISLSKDELAGARQYRQWRQEQGLSDTLAQKIERQPETAKLIGASHVYFFGEGLISAQDVKDWRGLKRWFLAESDLVSGADPTQLKELTASAGEHNWLSRYDKQLLVQAINQSLQVKFASLSPQGAANSIELQYQSAQQSKSYLAKHAHAYLQRPDSWGQGLAQSMIDHLQRAGIDNLWIGLNKWTSAFYQPQVVDSAKQAGYLIGSYDSYNTAIAPKVNDAWLTAQLPKSMREQCAIELENGQKKKGFRGNGFYLNPACRRDVVEQRVRELIKYGRFNSLFLDVDATGMVREDYAYSGNQTRSSASKGMTQAVMSEAFNDRMDWIAKQQKVVLGSEDGNAITTRAIAFAHGMETVGFGWNDPDMKKNRQSPYYLGAWYPDRKPAFFFQSAKVKEPYKSLLFAPQYRVPLYQTVFHNEVINSHHWHSDSVKFSNVQVERDLASMLYNTPPMVQLSRDETTSTSSARLKALVHYQQGFAPIHRVLWNKTLDEFKWLTPDGLVQQTVFSDGSVITANFSGRTYHDLGRLAIPGHAMVASLSSGEQVVWRAERFSH